MAWQSFKDIQATIQINLTKSLDELWNALDKDARWGVNKARKESLVVKVIDKDEDAWQEFYKMYVDTIIRGGIVPKELSELQQETGKLFLCYKANKLIAGAAIKLLDGKTELFLNASLFDYLKFQPNNLLYWTMIEWSKAQGYKIFDLGGYQLNTKQNDKLYHVNRFKERWGGEIKTYFIYSKNPLYILGRKVIRKIHFVKRARDKLKLNKWKKEHKYKEEEQT